MQPSFLQSKEWEEFQKSVGRKTWRIDEVLIVKHDLPFGFNYLYCPRPILDNKQPITNDKQQETIDNFFNEAQNIANTGKSIFLKIDPANNLQIANYNLQISKSIQPEKTLIIDLKKSEDELLRIMHEKTRYNIRLAERKGVQFAICNLQFSGCFEEFLWLLEETAKRDGFHTHEKRYYEKLLSVRSQNFSNKLFYAEYRGEILAAAIVNFYGDTAIYLHGASSRENKELMAPYLLHWRVIQEAKKRNFAKYDLGGIDEKKWPGVTRFKLGFGGEILEYPPSVDIVYKPIMYYTYKLARKLR